MKTINHFVIPLCCLTLYTGISLCGVAEEKQALRKKMLAILKNISDTEIQQESNVATLKLMWYPSFRSAARVGVFLSAKHEIETDKLISKMLGRGTRCYIPRCNGTEMDMVLLRSIDDLNKMRTGKLGVKEPDLYEKRENALTTGGLDLILVPGLAFTLKGARLGRGNGMYDRYIAKIRPNNNPALIGFALTKQLVKKIPTENHDIKVDTVITSKFIQNW